MNVGFIHGVMNTDNMTISGETIDYGPCAFMEAYDPATVFSSIDHGGRYAYGNQPPIARWNLARLAETLLPLMADGDDEAAVQQAVAQVTEVHRRLPGAVRARRCCRASAPSWACSAPATTPTTPRWPRTGWRCCTRTASTSRWPGGGWPMPRRATRHRCARCSRAAQCAQRLARPLARTLRGRRRTRRCRGRRRRSARPACAPSTRW